MAVYILKRLLWFIPGVFFISLIAFTISYNAPGDPLDIIKAEIERTDPENPEKEAAIINQWRAKLGLDLPIFYLSLASLSTPSAQLSASLTPEERVSLKRLSFQSGNAANSRLLHMSYEGMWQVLAADTGTVEERKRELALVRINALKTADSRAEIQQLMDEIRNLKILSPLFNQKYLLTDQLFRKWRIETSVWKSWTPTIRFHPDNKYHRWLLGDPHGLSNGVLKGDFGYSLITKQAVSNTLYSRFKWSASLALISVLLAFVISIPVGVWAGARPGSWFDRIVEFKLFLFFCIPTFWMGTLLLVIFANPDVLPWFPASGVVPPGGFTASMSFLNKIFASLPYLVLPIFCYTYASWAFTSRIIRSAVRDNMYQDHIRTAKAKGLPLTSIAFKHALKNALLPAITVFAEVFPMAVGGSVIIESIFGIPGMGFETVQAALNRDYPVIVAACTLSALLTMTGTLVADVLYTIADPRIQLKGGNNG
jgi:peptide/nickel transport system permease protein